MAGLQRSAVSFRRQGSSGLVWDDKFLSGELNQAANQKEESEENKAQQGEAQLQAEFQIQDDAVRNSRTPGRITTIERSRSNGGGRAVRSGKVSPAIEPPSPKLSVCGCCAAFGKENKTRRRPRSGKRRI